MTLLSPLKKTFKSTVKKLLKNFHSHILLPLMLLIILLVLVFFAYLVTLTERFYPITFVGNTNLSFLTLKQATTQLSANFDLRRKQTLMFIRDGDSFKVDLASTSAQIDYAFLEENLHSSHTGSLLSQLKYQLANILTPTQLVPLINIDLEEILSEISSQVEQKPLNARLEFSPNISTATTSAEIRIYPHTKGVELNKEALLGEITEFILTGRYKNNLPMKEALPSFTTDEAEVTKKTVIQVIKTPVQLKYFDRNYPISTDQLIQLLNLDGEQNTILNYNRTKAFLENIAKDIDQEVQEGLFEFDPITKRVTAFQAAQEGKKLDVELTFTLLESALHNSESSEIQLPILTITPKIQTEEVNNLGIKELIGQGVSHFAGSIPNRIFNVNHTAKKLNGTLVPPDSIFSFNATIGDISAATGFKQAYVIKEGRTVLDDGGGVCQDSTTLFRAVLNAGLPVLKRTAHAYRVGYYEQGFPPGLDATVFYPSVDFQFKNDTPGYILIQARTQGTTLYIDLYGTSDGRIATLTKPVITDQTPPPAELRQDDPALPRGTIKQVDWSAWGANVVFGRIVTRNGQEIINEKWRSNYKSWQAVYLVGTQ